MTQQFTFTKATRHAVKLKLGIDGPSGSGKTKGALAIAYGITRGGRIAVADSENGSAALYSDRYEFDHLNIPDPDPKTYRAIVDAAVEQGYDALIIDSLTHAWLHVLAAKEDYDRTHPQTNPWTNWRIFGPRWEELMQHILRAPIHIIGTMRSKQAYEQVETGGKKKVVKLGLQPQVRDGAEYEFSLVFSVEQNHLATATKDRTELFADREVDLCDPALHEELVGWMNAGGTLQLAPKPSPAPAETRQATPAAAPAPRTQEEEVAYELARASALRLKGKTDSWQHDGRAWGQQPIGEVPTKVLTQAKHFFLDLKKKGATHAWLDEQLEAIALVLADREAQEGQGALNFDTAANGETVIKRSTPSGGVATLETAHNVVALTKRISMLLENEQISAGKRESIKRQLQAAEPSIEELLQLLGDLEQDLSLPF